MGIVGHGQPPPPQGNDLTMKRAHDEGKKKGNYTAYNPNNSFLYTPSPPIPPRGLGMM